MKTLERLRAIAEICRDQWGMVTTEQAEARGLSSKDLDGFCDSGDMFQIRQGVYQLTSCPGEEHEFLRADWLAAEPTKLGYERLKERPHSLVVSGETASLLLGIGNLRASQNEFTSPIRRQTEQPHIRYRILQLPESDVTVRNGFPVTTRERTIADLIEDDQDLSLVADVLWDAAGQSVLNVPRLVELLDPLANHNGYANGRDFLNGLLEIAGLDVRALAGRLAVLPGLQEMVLDEIAASLSRDRLQQSTIEKLKELHLGFDSSQLQELRKTSQLIHDAFAALSAKETPTSRLVEDQLQALSEAAVVTLGLSDLTSRVSNVNTRYGENRRD